MNLDKQVSPLPLFPVLKESVRLKKLPEFCWVIDVEGEWNHPLIPMEAFFLANCNGELSTRDLSYMMQQLFGFSHEEAQGQAYAIIKKYENCIKMAAYSKKQNFRYDPNQFLYITDPQKSSACSRCHTPCEMHLSLTHGCNFRCIYCFNASGQRFEDELTTEYWLNIIRQAAGLQVAKCTLTGGEPMMHPGFFEIVEELCRLDMLTCICTNGSFLTEQAVSRLKSAGTPMVQVSLDTADGPLNKYMTKHNGLQEVLRGIRRLTDANIPVQVKSVLTPLNIASIPAMLHICQEVGVQKVLLDRFDISANGRGNLQLLVNDEQVEACKAQLRKESYGNMKVHALMHTQNWKTKDDIIPCGAFRRSFLVLPNGDMNACEKLGNVPEMTIGNLQGESLLDLWNSPVISTIIDPPPSRICSTCQTCQLFGQCRTGCYAIKYCLKQDFYSIDPRCMYAPKENNPYKNNVH